MGGEAYAAHRGINTAAQMRAQLDARLSAGKTAAPQVASSSRANSVAQTKPVAQMTTTEKLQFAVERAAAHLGPEAAEKLRALVTPENLTIMAGTTAALIAVQGVPVLDVIVDAGLAGLAVYSLGSDAMEVVKDLAGFASGVMNAKTENDLNAAGQHLARAVSTAGIDTVTAIVLHKTVKVVKGASTPPAGTVEMVTPEGIRIRVPVEESPAKANVVKMAAENESGGGTLARVAKPGGQVGKLKSFETNADVPARYRSDPRFNDLAKDPDHSGAIKPKTRAEAMAGLEAESQGLVKGPIKRGPKGTEFYDADGRPWDVKAPPSPKPGERWSFNTKKVGEAVLAELRNKATPPGAPKGTFSHEKTGAPESRRIILDSTYLSEADHAALWQWLNKNLTASELSRIVEVNTQH